MNCEEQINCFLEGCENWATARIEEIADQGAQLSAYDSEAIIGKAEEDLNHSIEKCIARYGNGFPFEVLNDLYHMIFEMEIKKAGIENAEQIHRFRANGQIALSVVAGTMDPESALLVMKINQAHLQKKGNQTEGICEDCACGRK